MGRRVEKMIKGIGNVLSPKEKVELLIKVNQDVCVCAQEVWGKVAEKTIVIAADELVPILCYIIVQSKIPNAFTECDFIEDFLNKDERNGMEGYTMANFRVAIEHL